MIRSQLNSSKQSKEAQRETKFSTRKLCGKNYMRTWLRMTYRFKEIEQTGEGQTSWSSTESGKKKGNVQGIGGELYLKRPYLCIRNRNKHSDTEFVIVPTSWDTHNKCTAFEHALTYTKGTTVQSHLVTALSYKDLESFVFPIWISWYSQDHFLSIIYACICTCKR